MIAAGFLPGMAHGATVRAGSAACDDTATLGQDSFRYRANRLWGDLDPRRYPVKDGHGIAINRHGDVVLLTNDTRNNLIEYAPQGGCRRAWEHRFPTAHGLEIVSRDGGDRYWITDHARRVVSVLDEDGHELMHVSPDAVSARYPDPARYRPTNVAVMPHDDFYVADGYGSSYVHHFDPKGRYISSFGGEGDAPEKLRTPHAVWIDRRGGNPQVLVCDRSHNMLKWFSPEGDLRHILDLGPAMADDEPTGIMPCNVTQFGRYPNGPFDDHIAVACLGGGILILDGQNRVVSVIGGAPPAYSDQKLQPVTLSNHVFNAPHDVCADAHGALYVSQWGINRTYPIKLEPIV